MHLQYQQLYLWGSCGSARLRCFLSGFHHRRSAAAEIIISSQHTYAIARLWPMCLLIVTLFPLHDQSYARQRPLLQRPDGPLSNTNQILGGRAKFVGFLDKSMLLSYPDTTASIPVLIPEDFSFFRLGTPANRAPWVV